jgi:hypothetical protein
LSVLIGGEEEAASQQTKSPVAPLLAAALLFVGLALVGGSTGGSQSQVEEPGGDSSLLHDLGSPVDTVEQFVAALNYGFVDEVVSAVALDAGIIELPYLPTPASPTRLSSTVGIFQDIDAAIAMYGCNATDGTRATEVECAIAYDSDFIREFRAQNLRGRMVFEVRGGLIAGASVLEMDEPLAGIEDTATRFDSWLRARFGP